MYISCNSSVKLENTHYSLHEIVQFRIILFVCFVETKILSLFIIAETLFLKTETWGFSDNKTDETFSGSRTKQKESHEN